MKNTEKNKNNRITQTIDFKETVITNFSGIYKNQNFYKNYAEEEISWTELSDLSGCNCYCDAEDGELMGKMAVYDLVNRLAGKDPGAF